MYLVVQFSKLWQPLVIPFDCQLYLAGTFRNHKTIVSNNTVYDSDTDAIVLCFHFVTNRSHTQTSWGYRQGTVAVYTIGK